MRFALAATPPGSQCFSAVKRYPDLYKQVEFEADDQTFKVANRNATAHWTWVEMLGYSETRHALQIRPNKHTKLVMPKRALSAPDGAAFDLLLRQKLKKLS